jgi:hypothetical protein
METEAMSLVLIIISGDPADDETIKFSRRIVERALQTDSGIVIEQVGANLDHLLRDSGLVFSHIFVLGEVPLELSTVNFLLDDKWRQNPMRVVAVSETGQGAQLLRHRQLELLGSGFDRGTLLNGTECALFRLLPTSVGA